MCGGHRQIQGSCEFVDERGREKTGLIDCGFRQDWINPPSSIKPTGYSWGQNLAHNVSLVAIICLTCIRAPAISEVETLRCTKAPQEHEVRDPT